MLASLADHLWQSLVCCGLGFALVAMTRSNAAAVRLWIWRICLIKMAVPFALVFALGEWLGFPAPHAADAVPDFLRGAAAALMPWFAPAKSLDPKYSVLIGGLLVAGGALIACGLAIRRRERQELTQVGHVSDEQEAAPLGFLRAFALTLAAMMVTLTPLLGGAIADRNWRRELMIEHVQALRDAPVFMDTAKPGMGSRSRIETRIDGVLIRNINIQELLAMSYGVTRYAITSNQMFPENSTPEQNSWLYSPRYDVFVTASLRERDDFNSYALRQRITRLLVERFGLEIMVNGECQRPCGRWDQNRDESLL